MSAAYGPQTVTLHDCENWVLMFTSHRYEKRETAVPVASNKIHDQSNSNMEV